MRWRSFALLTLSISCAIALSAPSRAQHPCEGTRVVDGDPTDIKEHPWQVALEIDGGLCGGVIIHPSWVLTAAHCFLPEFTKVRVKAGATNYKIGGAWTAVDRVVLHKFDRQTSENDLALVKLKTRPAGRAIRLPKADMKVAHCQTLEVTGWGRTEADRRKTADVLQLAEVPHVDTALCNEPQSHNGKVRPSQICAGGGTKDACKGDSGGPLVLTSKTDDGKRKTEDAVLVGIVSWGESCGKQLKYGVYTRVSAHLDWIGKVIAEGK